MQTLTLRAGPDALALLHERGLRGEDVDLVPGASGGPKWLVLAGLDRYVFGELLQAPRTRPLHLVGSSIGSWRLACAAQADPVAAIERFEAAYLDQRYPKRRTPALVSAKSREILGRVLGERGAAEIVASPWVRLHVIVAACRGLAASENASLLFGALTLSAAGNLVSRATLAWQLGRAIFHPAGDGSPLRPLADLPTTHHALDADTLVPALIASGSIPLVLEGVRIPGAPAPLYRDGGMVDYHLDLDWGPGEGLVLYPHFYPHLVPGWFDKGLSWRRADARKHRRVLLVAPSPELVASLPGGRIPDRKDFDTMEDADREAAWRRVLELGRRMGDELRELVATGRVAERATAWTS